MTSNKYPSKGVFGIDSAHRLDSVDSAIAQATDEIAEADFMFKENATRTAVVGFTKDTKRKITNADADRMWFRDNVFFIFSTGCIYDEEDGELLSKVLAYFHEDDHVAFLDNKILVLSYTNDMVKAIENNLAIENGNYHVLCVPVVYKTANVNDAPEGLFMKTGLIDKYISWKEISGLMVNCITKYGLLIERMPDKEDRSRLKSVPAELAMHYDKPIDPDEPETIQWQQSIETNHELEETFRKRVRHSGVSRDGSLVGKHPDKRRYGAPSNKSLMTRIREEHSLPDSKVQHQVGGELRYDERKMPAAHEDKVIPEEYELFDNFGVQQRMKNSTRTNQLKEIETFDIGENKLDRAISDGIPFGLKMEAQKVGLKPNSFDLDTPSGNAGVRFAYEPNYDPSVPKVAKSPFVQDREAQDIQLENRYDSVKRMTLPSFNFPTANSGYTRGKKNSGRRLPSQAFK